MSSLRYAKIIEDFTTEELSAALSQNGYDEYANFVNVFKIDGKKFMNSSELQLNQFRSFLNRAQIVQLLQLQKQMRNDPKMFLKHISSDVLEKKERTHSFIAAKKSIESHFIKEETTKWKLPKQQPLSYVNDNQHNDINFAMKFEFDDEVSYDVPKRVDGLLAKTEMLENKAKIEPEQSNYKPELKPKPAMKPSIKPKAKPIVEVECKTKSEKVMESDLIPESNMINPLPIPEKPMHLRPKSALDPKKQIEVMTDKANVVEEENLYEPEPTIRFISPELRKFTITEDKPPPIPTRQIEMATQSLFTNEPDYDEDGYLLSVQAKINERPLPEIPNIMHPITDNRYYHNKTKQESELFLSNLAIGYFIFRPSKNYPAVLMVNTRHKLLNIPVVESDLHTYYLLTENDSVEVITFDDLNVLIQYYTINNIYYDRGVIKLRPY